MKYLFSFTTETGHSSLLFPYSITQSFENEVTAILYGMRTAKKLVELKKSTGYYTIQTWNGPETGYQVIKSGKVGID